MSSWTVLFVWLVSAVTLALLVAAFGGPGYLDAEYAYHVAVNLAAGRGFQSDVIWTYLTDPARLPVPSHLYWMPLASTVAAPFIRLFGPVLWVAEIPFVALGAAVPAATALVARAIFATTWQAVVAGALTLFSGYYFLYWAAIDAFAVFALAAGATFLATAGLLRERVERGRALRLGILLGAGAAVAHLARADGPLLLLAALLTLLLFVRPSARTGAFGALGIALAVYAGLMLPWWLRNLAVADTPWPVGGFRTIFLREYADLFAYGRTFGPVDYFAAGLPAIVGEKLAAAGRNLFVFFGGAYWLAPFAVAGWWKLRSHRLLKPPLVYGTLLYLTMSFVFTAPSGHGSLLHSAAAVVPWLSIAAVRGLAEATRLLARHRPAWRVPHAARNLAIVVVIATAIISVVWTRDAVAARDAQVRAYAALAAVAFGGSPSAPVFVLDPPGWWYATGGSALMTPSNGPDAALAAAIRFGATHLVWQPGYPPAWEGIDADSRFRLVVERPPYRVYQVVLGAD